MDKPGREKLEPAVLEVETPSEKERTRSKSIDSRGSSISSEVDSDTQRGARRRSKESAVSQEKPVDRRISEAIEEEDAFLDFIRTLPAMAPDKVAAYEKSQRTPEYKRSASEAGGGLEHLDNLYRLMDHLGQLKVQNSKLQERVKYLEERKEHEDEGAKSKRGAKCKSSHYGIRQTFMKSRERSRSVGVEEIAKSTARYRQEFEHGAKSKVSKWSKVKEAFRWEKASSGVLPEAKSQDSGLGGGDDLRFLRVPSEHSSASGASVSPADSVLSGQSLSPIAPAASSPASTSDEDLAAERAADFSRDPDMSPRSFRRDGDDPRRSQSLDGDGHLINCDLLASHDTGKDDKIMVAHKGTKTPWGKMKDIIQTRTGSIKKKKSDNNDAEDDARSGTMIEGAHLEESSYDFETSTGDVSGERCDIEAPGDQLKRRLAPTLTITLPSTEELRCGREAEAEASAAAKAAAKPPPSPQTDERHLKSRQRPIEEDAAHSCLARKISGGSAGTSPPTPRRLSKWSKVKNAFLTSSASVSEDCLHRGSSSVPSSPVNKTATFAYDLESDELSSGEFMDDGARDDDVFPDAVKEMCDLKEDTIHAEVQRNYEALQLKLSEEFHKKLCEWERIKYAGSPGTPPCTSRVAGSGFSSGTSSIADDPPHDKGFRKKMEEWEKIKSPGSSGAKHRESVTLQQLGEENLSAEFKKKLDEWEKIKSLPTPQTPDIVNIAQPQFKKKISEWQLWRPGVMTSKSDAGIAGMSSPMADLPEDFYKKLQEWERLKQGTSFTPHPDTESPGNKTPSPDSTRRESVHKPGKSQHSPTYKKDKSGADFGFQIRIQKSKSHHEVKELAWLEKELHKIDREKQRLEREREKYLEREARLEKLRTAIGANLKKQEILIPTSTGLFRFEGISQKFTRKLYEWEKAKGIGPEASTFALLDPGYQPPGASSDGQGPDGNGSFLARSKSMGSVVELSQNTLTQQPSSLSLSHMEQFETNQLSSAYSEDEPQALIVDVEDVIEETASPLEHPETIESQTPVYCYAPSEVTRLIDSSGSDSDKELRLVGLQAQSSIELLQENFTLLDKLQRTEHICRGLEVKIEDVEDKLNTTERIHKEHLGSYAKSGDGVSDQYLEQVEDIDEIKEKLQDLETRQEQLRQEGEVLQHSFAEHSEQQAMIAQDLVGKVRQLQDSITGATPELQPPGEGRPLVVGPEVEFAASDPLAQVQALTHQLLNLAQELELAVGERNQEMSVLRKALSGATRAPGLQKLRSSPHWFSTDSVSSVGVTDKFPANTSSEELSRLPVLLTKKLQELKNQLGSLSPLPCITTVPVFFTQTPLSIINPESPEVETTFVFNLGKKRRDEVAIESSLDPVEVERETLVDEISLIHDSLINTSNVFDLKEYKEEQNKRSSPALELGQSKSGNHPGCDQANYSSENEGKYACADLVDPTESMPSVTNKMYFSKSAVHISTDSDDTDCEQSYANKISTKEVFRISDSENAKEKAVMKKHKRSRINSGLLERRRSRTDSKDDNSDDEDDHISETNSSKRAYNYESRYKKVLKSKGITREDTSMNKNGNLYSSENNDTAHSTIQKNVGTVLGPGKSITSPKCVSRRNKKTPKPKEDKDAIEKECVSPNYYSTAPIPQGCNQEMTVNVFVPTTRKIFSPVRKDSKGDTSTVISYVLEEPDQTSCVGTESEVQNVNEVIKKNSDEGSSYGKNNAKYTDQSEPLESAKEDKKPKYDFVLPPCWIIKQVRAQSASPALQRRTLQRPWNKEKTTDTDEKPSEHDDNNIKNDTNITGDKLQLSEGFDEVIDDTDKNKASGSEPQNKTPVPQICSIPCRDSLLKDAHRKTSSSSESVENNRPLRKEGCSIPASLKLRTEAGFPPISPLTVRREMKVLKDTAPSIRQMIAKYNQKVHQSQELTGTKSPESGGQSPIAWRSPVTERRVRGQLDRYHEEVRKALQPTCGNECCSNGTLGQVQKSASAGYIRPFDKGCSSDSINGKCSEKSSPLLKQHHGILKSSSAGAIKTCSLLSSRHGNSNSSETKICHYNSSELSPLPIRKAEHTSSTKVTQIYNKIMDVPQSPDCQGSTQEIQVEKVKAHILHIPTLIENDTNIYSKLSPDSTRLRALKIKKAKEEFLSRGCVGEIDSSTTQACPSTSDTPIQNERLSWTNSKSRLSQVSCGSESSYENVPMVLVRGKGENCDHDGNLLVKSASAGMINVDSTVCSRVFAGTSSPEVGSSQGTIPKSKSGILSRFRKARLKRKDKDSPRIDAVSTLCRQSLVVDINKKGQTSEALTSSSKSCPSSPVLQKKDQPAASWILNPKRIFLPK